MEDGRAMEEGGKYKKAKANGKTKIISETEFEELIQDKVGVNLEESIN